MEITERVATHNQYKIIIVCPMSTTFVCGLYDTFCRISKWNHRHSGFQQKNKRTEMPGWQSYVLSLGVLFEQEYWFTSTDM